MQRMLVRQMHESEWKAYRELRLRALQESPEAFGSTYADAVVLPDDHWSERLRGGTSPWDLPLFAKVDDELVGLVWGKIEPPELQIVHVYQMWVAPDFRGFGVGRMLLGTVVAWAKSLKARKVVLEVTCGDTPARRLYASMGFRASGAPVPVRRGEHLLEQSMVFEFSDG